MSSALTRFFSSVVALITSFSLFSCNSNRFDEEKIGKDMEVVLTQLFDAVHEGDEKTFKNFFADHVVELPDFEDGCKYVFDVYKGELLGVKCHYPIGTGDHIVPGEQICYAFTIFDIITRENNYTVYVEFYTRYKSKYPDFSYKIRKFKLLNKQQLDADETFNDCTQRNGIYYPGWINEKVE